MCFHLIIISSNTLFSLYNYQINLTNMKASALNEKKIQELVVFTPVGLTYLSHAISPVVLYI